MLLAAVHATPAFLLKVLPRVKTQQLRGADHNTSIHATKGNSCRALATIGASQQAIFTFDRGCPHFNLRAHRGNISYRHAAKSTTAKLHRQYSDLPRR